MKTKRTTGKNFPEKPVPRSFLNKLGEMHTAEKELSLALPLIAKAAKSKDLKTLLQIHLKETKGHVKCIEAVAESLGEKLPTKSCKPMTQLIKEGVKVMARKLGSSEMDPALIEVGQKIEQFEISAYTPLCSTAREMGDVPRLVENGLVLIGLLGGNLAVVNDLVFEGSA